MTFSRWLPVVVAAGAIHVAGASMAYSACGDWLAGHAEAPSSGTRADAAAAPQLPIAGKQKADGQPCRGFLCRGGGPSPHRHSEALLPASDKVGTPSDAAHLVEIRPASAGKTVESPIRLTDGVFRRIDRPPKSQPAGRRVGRSLRLDEMSD